MVRAVDTEARDPGRPKTIVTGKRKKAVKGSQGYKPVNPLENLMKQTATSINRAATKLPESSLD